MLGYTILVEPTKEQKRVLPSTIDRDEQHIAEAVVRIRRKCGSGGIGAVYCRGCVLCGKSSPPEKSRSLNAPRAHCDRGVSNENSRSRRGRGGGGRRQVGRGRHGDRYREGGTSHHPVDLSFISFI